MPIYSINPKFNVGSENIINIMTQLIYDISKSINSIYNIVIYEQYILMINNINDILNNYLKIYYFLKYNIKNIYVQIYNQNINLVSEIYINIIPYKYININSNWESFIKGTYYNSNKIVYSQLDMLQKNNLRYSIISGDLYFIDNIVFTYNNLNTIGMLIKPVSNNDCACNTNTNTHSNIQTNNNYCYITTLYWN